MKILAETQSATTPGRMKYTFCRLCCFLCLFSIVLYSNTTVNWKSLHTKFLRNYRPSSITETVPVAANQTVPIAANRTLLLTSRRFAIFACSIHSSTQAYIFYTPITAASWKRIGYETIVFFVGDFTLPNVLTARLNLSRSYLRHVGAQVVDIQCDSKYAVKLSQLVRVFAGFLPDSIVRDDDDILTGDSDLMPLKASEYQTTPKTDGFIFNAFCCGSFQRRSKTYRMFPMGHIFLKKRVWRAIVLESQQRSELLANASQATQLLLRENATLSFELISLYSRHEFKAIYDSNMAKGDSAWYMDQVLCSMLLTDYRERHKNFTLSERGRAGRLDRASGIGAWNREKFDQFGDAHLIHDAILQEGNWKIFNRLLKALFDQTIVNLFNDYYRQYIIASNNPTSG